MQPLLLTFIMKQALRECHETMALSEYIQIFIICEPDGGGRLRF